MVNKIEGIHIKIITGGWRDGTVHIKPLPEHHEDANSNQGAGSVTQALGGLAENLFEVQWELLPQG